MILSFSKLLATKQASHNEIVFHVFCESEKVWPLWDELLQLINDNIDKLLNYFVVDFDLMFGVSGDSFVTFLWM